MSGELPILAHSNIVQAPSAPSAEGCEEGISLHSPSGGVNKYSETDLDGHLENLSTFSGSVA